MDRPGIARRGADLAVIESAVARAAADRAGEVAVAARRAYAMAGHVARAFELDLAGRVEPAMAAAAAAAGPYLPHLPVDARGRLGGAGELLAGGTARLAQAAEASRIGTSRALLMTRAGQPGIGSAAVGLGAAQLAFAATFRGPRQQFWNRMTLTGLALGGYALMANPGLRQTRLRPRDVATGLASAAALYGTFAIGDRLARRFVPSGQRDIADIYALRELRSKPEIAARLVTVIAPAEELFWRGLLQEAFMARYGRWTGAALGALAYGGVHLVTGNFTLFGAAGIAGAQWSALYAAGTPLSALIVSHTVWDVWIFLVQPTSEVSGEPRATGEPAASPSS